MSFFNTLSTVWHAGFYLHSYQQSSELLCSVIFKFATPKLLWASPQDTAIFECWNKTTGETSPYLWCGTGNTPGSRNNHYSQAWCYWARHLHIMLWPHSLVSLARLIHYTCYKLGENLPSAVSILFCHFSEDFGLV